MLPVGDPDFTQRDFAKRVGLTWAGIAVIVLVITGSICTNIALMRRVAAY